METERPHYKRPATELRQHHRFLAQWRVAIVFQGGGSHTFYGVTHDVGLGGLCMHTDHNLYSRQTVSVLLALPPAHPRERKKMIEAEGRIVYTILSSGQKGFRIGIQLVRFKNRDENLFRNYLISRFGNALL
jgi:hypothetical protein